jgi:hypothetical protein
MVDHRVRVTAASDQALRALIEIAPVGVRRSASGVDG